MTSPFKYFCAVILLICLIENCQAQSFTTKIYTTADGLSDNYIFRIYQDSFGYLWIGTPNGLNRFDGKRFTHYGLNQGLPSLYVDAIYEDHNHRLWIGTRRGIAELKGDSCYTYPLSDGADIEFIGGFIEPGNGRLWATTDRGVYEFEHDHWMKVRLYDPMGNHSVGRIIKTSQGLFINYDNRMLVLQKPDGSHKIILSANTNRPYYNSLYEKNDTVYISTYSGLMYWSGTGWTSRYADTLSRKYVYTSFVDKSNRFWFGTAQDGILSISSGANKTDYLHFPLAFNLVSNFLEDREGNIWAAGFQGLVKISPSPYQIFAPGGHNQIESIRNCIALPSGKMLVSCRDGKLYLIDATRLVKSMPAISMVFHLDHPSDFVDYYTFDEKQRLLFTTREGGLYRWDGQSLTPLKIIRYHNSLVRGIAYDEKRKRLYVCADSVLLAGDEVRLDTFFSNHRKFIPIPALVYVNEFDGSLLTQTAENGSYLVSAKGEIDTIGKGLNLFSSFRDAYKSGEDVIIWAAIQGSNISEYRWKGSHRPYIITMIGAADGFTDNSILDMEVDADQRLWVVTSKGVTVMEKDREGTWIHQEFEITESGSVVPLSFTRLAEDINGNMWMSLADKLVMFDHEKIHIVPTPTTTVIEKVLLYDRPTDWALLADSLDSYRRLPVRPVLSHDQNSLSIIFNGLVFNNNSRIEYSYRLLPSDTSWSDPTSSEIVTFYQLAPGTYQFEARSHAKGFGWSKPAVFSFMIKKPFWETWWFRLAVIIAASSLIAFIFRSRIRQLQEKAVMSNRIRELEMKALKAQMNPHFIHNALNSIQSLIINDRSSEASHYISKFAKLLRQVLENADKNLIALDRELYSLQLYVELEKLRMNVDIEYSEALDESVIASEIRIPPLILQPFVENALWHGLNAREGTKRLIVSIREENGWIICEITDNGVGRKQAEESSKPFPEGSLSKAVNITSQRLVDFNRSSGVEPVSFIDLVNETGAAGTTVIVRIRVLTR